MDGRLPGPPRTLPAVLASAVRRLPTPPAALAWLTVSLTAAAALLGMVLAREGMAEDDRPLLSWLVGHRSPGWTDLMTAVSSSVVVGIAIAAALAAAASVAARTRSWRPLATVVLALCGSSAAGVLVKTLVRRSRPPLASMLGAPETDWSFPSNHTLIAASLAGGLAILVWRTTAGVLARGAAAGLAVGAALLMGASRLYLGDHWLTDVLASYALAVGVLAAVAWLTGPAGEQWLRRALRRSA